MRRPLFALIWLSIVITVLIGLKSAPAAEMLGWSAESPFGPDGLSDDGDGGGTTTDPPAQPDGSSPAGDPSGGPAPSGTAQGGTAPSGATTSSAPGGTTATSGPPAGTTTTTAAAPPGVSGTFTGAAIAVRTAQSPSSKSRSCSDCANYSISVTITVSNGKITAASVAYSPSPGESQSYASQANNKLKASILTQQTWNLGRVSGATYSGNAWELSVKDAMSKAGLPV